MARFDIYVAKVYFRGSEEYAIRPIIQVKKDADKPFAFAMITSHEKRDWESELNIPHKIYKHKTEDFDDDFDMNLYLLEELKDV